MDTIRDNHTLRIAYELLNDYKELGYDTLRPDKVIKVKQNIREYLRKTAVSDRRLLHGDIDGYVLLIQCPDWVETEEDAEEWFDNCERKTYIWSPYDCTGQLFTYWHSCKKRNGKWICYHGVAADV